MDKKIIGYIAWSLTALLVILGLWWLVNCHCVNLRELTPAMIRDHIRGFGNAAPIVYVLAYALNTISILPPIGVLSLTAGLAFGKIWGAVLLMAGAVLGTSITFFISRSFGRTLVEKITPKRFKNLDDLLEKKGFLTIFFFRVVPLIPFEVLNYASGISKIKFRDYFFATFLGLIPGVIIAAFFGGTLGEIKGLRDLISFKFILAISALFIVILAPVIYRRLREKGGKRSG